MSEKNLKIAAAVLLCAAITAGAYALQYRHQAATLRLDYERTLKELEDFTALVNIKIDYGNETTWYNDTRVSLGTSLLNATGKLVEVEAQESELGSFVTSLGGVVGDSSHYWMWSIYDGGWEMGPVGADQWTLHDGDVVAWTYTAFR